MKPLRRGRIAGRAPFVEIAMPAIDSSVIARVSYEASTRELDVTFHTGRKYIYFEVPPEVYFQFMRASSSGAFFNIMIRDRYHFEERSR